MARFLVVDDDADTMGLIQFILESRGHQVVAISSGEEALELIEKDKAFDFILLDIFLLGINGIAVCQKLKSDKELKHIPIGIITITPTSALRQKAQKMGAEHFFAKPIDVNNFALELEALLNHPAN